MSFASRTRWVDLSIASLAQFFASLGTFLVMVTLILALQRQGAGGMEVALLVLAEALPVVVLGALIGRLVDRFDSRLLLILAGAGQVLACLALSQATELPAILLGAVALSVASGIAVPTRQALIPSMVRRDDLPRASAIGQTASSAGMMLGPALAGFMVGGLGPQQTVRIAAAGFLATILAGLALRTRRGGTPAPATADAPGPVEVGWRLRDDRLLWSSAWGLTSVLAAMSAVNVVLVFFIIRGLGGTERLYGVVDSMWTVGVLIGAWAFSRLVRPATADGAIARRVFGALGVLALAVLLVGTVPDALWIVPMYLVGGAQNGGLNVLVGTLMGRRVPAPARGRAAAALTMRVQAGAMLGYLAGGLLLEVAPPRVIVLGCGVLGLATVLAVVPFVLRAARTAAPDLVALNPAGVS